MSTPTTRGLLERLEDGPVICAEGYLFEFERRGYLQAGAFVPEVVLEQPELVEELHREFVHAGSDVVEAFTYYAHREKLRVIGKEHLLEPINRQRARDREDGGAAKPARCSAGEHLQHERLRRRRRPRRAAVRAMFEEQVGWAVEAGVDFVIGETFSWGEEALIALDVIKQTGLPAVITLVDPPCTARSARGGARPRRAGGWRDAGADVVGVNCIRGPKTMLPLLGAIRAARRLPRRRAAGAVPDARGRADLPVAARRRMRCELPGGRPFPTALDPFTCNRYEIAEFAPDATRSGVRYLGVCCGAAPHHIRSMAEALGRRPPASRFTADMSKHAFLGTDAKLKGHNLAYAKEL